MHQLAELGVAAHWKYKEGNGQSQGVEARINWLRKLLSWRDDMVESGSLQEEFKKQVFENRVYVFTPMVRLSICQMELHRWTLLIRFIP